MRGLSSSAGGLGRHGGSGPTGSAPKVNWFMPRRILFAVLIACFAALAAAVVPWRLSSDTLRSWASDPLRRISGLELAAAGSGTIAILPVPRLRLDSITLAAPDGTPVVRGGPLKGEIRILPLLIGR